MTRESNVSVLSRLRKPLRECPNPLGGIQREAAAQTRCKVVTSSKRHRTRAAFPPSVQVTAIRPPLDRFHERTGVRNNVVAQA